MAAYHRVYDSHLRRLIAKNRDQMQNPALRSWVWVTFTFLVESCLAAEHARWQWIHDCDVRISGSWLSAAVYVVRCSTLWQRCPHPSCPATRRRHSSLASTQRPTHRHRQRLSFSNPTTTLPPPPTLPSTSSSSSHQTATTTPGFHTHLRSWRRTRSQAGTSWELMCWVTWPARPRTRALTTPALLFLLLLQGPVTTCISSPEHRRRHTRRHRCIRHQREPRASEWLLRGPRISVTCTVPQPPGFVHHNHLLWLLLLWCDCRLLSRWRKCSENCQKQLVSGLMISLKQTCDTCLAASSRTIWLSWHWIVIFNEVRLKRWGDDICISCK